MNFWFELLDIHMNEKTITFHDYHGFKWQNINIYPILIIFLYNPTSFLVCWIVTSPIQDKIVIHVAPKMEFIAL